MPTYDLTQGRIDFADGFAVHQILSKLVHYKIIAVYNMVFDNP